MDRLERLVNLVAALIDTGHPLTREQIHQRIEGYSDDPDAFRRNFERDKELLRQMGLPLATEPLDPNHPEEVGYRIPREQYELPDPGLDEHELAALRLASAAVQVDGSWGRRRHGAGLAEAGRRRHRAVRRRRGRRRRRTGRRPRRAGWPPCPAAKRWRWPSGRSPSAPAGPFSYRGGTRLVDPWRLSFRRGQWYLAGLDHRRGEERLFRLDRVEGPLVADGPPGAFARPPGGAAARRRRGGWATTTRSWPSCWSTPSRPAGRVDALGPDAVRDAAARRLGRLRGGGDQRGGLPVLRARLPRSRRDLGPPDAARRHGRPGWRSLAGADRRRSLPMAKTVAEDRLGRLLAIVPWVAAHDGPEVAEVCRRFGVGEKELLDDLDLLFMCGIHPFTPDVLIDVDVADGRVWIRMADYFRRPAAPQPARGTGPGVGRLRPALRARARTPTGRWPPPSPSWRTCSASAPTTAWRSSWPGHARRCSRRSARPRTPDRKVEIDYYSFGRDGHSTRVVQPWRVFNAERPVVRVRLVRAGRRRAAVPGRPHQPGRGARRRRSIHRPTGRRARPTVYHPGARRPAGRARPGPAGPLDRRAVPQRRGRGRRATVLRVALRTSQKAWLERLLLRAGPHARVVEGDAAARAAAAAAAPGPIPALAPGSVSSSVVSVPLPAEPAEHDPGGRDLSRPTPDGRRHRSG